MAYNPPNYIPTTWIEEQIKKNPGHLAFAWKQLLEKWNGEKKTEEGFVRLHIDISALDTFWRNE